MKHEHKSAFTANEIAELRQLVSALRPADPNNKNVRGRMRRIGFHILDFKADQKGFSLADLEGLIAKGAITVKT